MARVVVEYNWCFISFCYSDNLEGSTTKIVEQSPIFKPDDLIPVTCNLNALVMAYALKIGGILFAKQKKYL